jgi:hypothetical protein
LSDQELFTVICFEKEAASKTNDIRMGFAIILSAGLKAQRKRNTAIDIHDIKYAVQN